MSKHTHTHWHKGIVVGILLASLIGFIQYPSLLGSIRDNDLRIQRRTARLQERLTRIPLLGQHYAAIRTSFSHTVYPVEHVPNWGAMRTSQEWDRSFDEMTPEDFVSIPEYNLSVLTIPLEELAEEPITPDRFPLLTAKLFYSTRFFGNYDLDSGEFEAPHPGIDLKLAPGTPIHAIAAGMIHKVVINDPRLGNTIIIEHESPEGRVFSIYGHLDDVYVKAGNFVELESIIGTVGMTGATTAPHLHLQIDQDDGTWPHIPYAPDELPSRVETSHYVIHPIEFIERYKKRQRDGSTELTMTR